MATKQTAVVAANAVKPIDAFKNMLNAESVKEQFKNALGKSSSTFSTSLVDLFSGNRQLQTCKPEYLIKEALRAATLRLPLNDSLGFA